MATKSLNNLFVHFMRDMYHAEKQGVRQMKQVGRRVENEELKQLLEQHREETEGQIERLEKVFEMLEVKARGTTSDAIQGINEEAKELMEDANDGPTRDLCILAGIQAVEHYEISRYGTMMAWAEALGHKDAVKLLGETLKEEQATDEKLSKLAKDHLDRMAKAEEESEEDDESEGRGKGQSRGKNEESGKGGKGGRKAA